MSASIFQLRGVMEPYGALIRTIWLWPPWRWP